MSIVNLTLLSGATVSATGGTTVTFGPSGAVVNRGIQVVDTAEADIRTQDMVTFKSVRGALQPDGTWSKNRFSAKITCPDLLSDSTQDFPSIEISYVGSPLNSAAKLAAIKSFAAQLLIDSDLTNFWANGSLA